MRNPLRGTSDRAVMQRGDLSEMLRELDSPAMMEEVFYALAEEPDPELADEIIASVVRFDKRGQRQLANWAGNALSNCGPVSVAELKPWLEAEAPQLKERAIELAGRWGNPADAPLIEPFLDAPNEAVRNAAWGPLLKWGNPVAISRVDAALASVTETGELSQAKAVIDRLGAVGSDLAVETLIELADVEPRPEAIEDVKADYALEQLGRLYAVPVAEFFVEYLSRGPEYAADEGLLEAAGKLSRADISEAIARAYPALGIYRDEVGEVLDAMGPYGRLLFALVRDVETPRLPGSRPHHAPLPPDDPLLTAGRADSDAVRDVLRAIVGPEEKKEDGGLMPVEEFAALDVKDQGYYLDRIRERYPVERWLPYSEVLAGGFAEAKMVYALERFGNAKALPWLNELRRRVDYNPPGTGSLRPEGIKRAIDACTLETADLEREGKSGVEALENFVRRNDPRARPYVLEGIRSVEDRYLLDDYVEMGAAMPNDAIVTAIIELARSERAEDNHEDIAEALATIGGPRVEPLLREYLAHEDIGVAIAAGDGLARMESEASALAIFEAVQSGKYPDGILPIRWLRGHANPIATRLLVEMAPHVPPAFLVRLRDAIMARPFGEASEALGAAAANPGPQKAFYAFLHSQFEAFDGMVARMNTKRETALRGSWEKRFKQ